MNKKMIISVITLFFSLTLLTKWAFAAGMLTLNVNLAPFKWVVQDHTYSSEEPFYNGKKNVPSSVNYEGTTYIPIALLAKRLGYKVTWDGATKTASLLDPELEDDPVADLDRHVKPANFAPETKTVTAAEFRSEPSSNAKVLDSLKAGASMIVLTEINPQWIKVIYQGEIGYTLVEATDYVPASNRPQWEQTADSIISIGIKYLGTPYDFGASLKRTDVFDCSSFVNYLYRLNGIELPRNSRQQSEAGKDISFEQLRKGDLLFFTTSNRKNKEGIDRIGHVAIYLGDQKVLHTYRQGIGVTVTELDSNWRSRFLKAKRVIE